MRYPSCSAEASEGSRFCAGGRLRHGGPGVFFLAVLETAPGLRFGTWCASSIITVLLVIGAVLAYAFYTSLGGRTLFAESMVPHE